MEFIELVIILILFIVGFYMLKNNMFSTITLTDYIAGASLIIAILVLIWTIIAEYNTSERLKLFDRPKVTLTDIQLIPYETNTAEYFKSKAWGSEEPLIFPTQSKLLLDYGKFDLLSMVDDGKLRLQGQVNFKNKGSLELSNLEISIQAFFNNKKFQDVIITKSIDPIFPDDEFNARFICLIPKENLNISSDILLLKIVLKYEDSRNVEYTQPPYWVVYDSKVNNWAHSNSGI